MLDYSIRLYGEINIAPSGDIRANPLPLDALVDKKYLTSPCVDAPTDQRCGPWDVLKEMWYESHRLVLGKVCFEIDQQYCRVVVNVNR